MEESVFEERLKVKSERLTHGKNKPSREGDLSMVKKDLGNPPPPAPRTSDLIEISTPFKTQITPTEKMILEYFKSRGKMTPRELAEELQISEELAARYLRELEKRRRM